MNVCPRTQETNCRRCVVYPQIWVLQSRYVDVGSYIVGCTFYATLYKEDPRGLPHKPYQITDPKLAEVIQQAVWHVVCLQELAGVKPPVNSLAPPVETTSSER